MHWLNLKATAKTASENIVSLSRQLHIFAYIIVYVSIEANSVGTNAVWSKPTLSVEEHF